MGLASGARAVWEVSVDTLFNANPHVPDAISKVLKQIHPDLGVTQDAENLTVRLSSAVGYVLADPTLSMALHLDPR